METRVPSAYFRSTTDPLAVLVRRSRSRDWSVRHAAACDERLPSEDLLRLGNDENPGVRAAIARHPSTTPESQVGFAKDPDWVVRIVLCGRANLARAAIETLKQDAESRVRRQLLLRTDLTEQDRSEIEQSIL